MPSNKSSNLLAPNLSDLKDSIDRLLFKSKDPIVIAIKGGWGEGKTYFWKNNIASAHKNLAPGYVSVFQAESLEAIQRDVIVQAAASHKVGSQAVPDSIRRIGAVLGGAGWFRQTVSKAIGLPNISFAFLPQLLEQFIFKPKWVLCFDDIERLPPNIELDAFLGYVNSLREDRGLRIVLIYNDEKVSRKNRRKSLKRYMEKIVDREFRFSPDIGNILRLVLDEDCIGTDILDDLERKCNVLSLRNIRIINRVNLYYREVKEILPKDCDSSFLKSVISSLLLYSWMNFASADAKKRTLTFDFVESYSELTSMLERETRDAEEEDADNLQGGKVLAEFGYARTDDVDLVLMSLVRRSVLDKERLLEEYKKYMDNTSRGKLEKHLTNVWQRFFHGTLRETEDEFCRELIIATEQCFDFISLRELDSTLSTLSDLNRNDDALGLFKRFITSRPSAFKDPDHESMTMDIRFEPIKEALDEAGRELKADNRSLGEIIHSATSGEFMYQGDRDALARFSAEDFVTYFSENDLKHLTGIMRRIHRQTRRRGDDIDKKINSSIVRAATIIADRSPINKLRMQHMGLLVDVNKSEIEEQK